MQARTIARKRPRPAVIILAAVAVSTILFVLYLFLSISSLIGQFGAPAVSGPSSVSVSFVRSGILFHDSALSLVPYVMLSYSSRNSTSLFINASLVSGPLPTSVYMLNTSNGECYNNECDNAARVFSLLEQDLLGYGLPGYADIRNVSVGGLASLPGNSILIVPTGLLPQQFLNATPGYTLLDHLLRNGTSVIYLGGSFSSVLIRGSTYTYPSGVPSYLSTYPVSNYSKGGQLRTFFFSNKTFSFSNGTSYGPLTYVNAYNGAVIAFSNNLDSWPAAEVAADLAKAISERFWLPSYAHGTASLSVGPNESSGRIDVLLNHTSLGTGISYGNAQSSLSQLNGSHLVVTLYSNASYGTGNGSAYSYLYREQAYSALATLSIPEFVLPNRPVSIGVQVFNQSPSQQYFFSVYNAISLSRTSRQLPPLSNITTGNFSAYEYFQLPPGRYIVSLTDQYSNEYASALFTVPNLNVSLVGADFKGNNYSVRLTMNNISLSGISYVLTLSNCLPACQPHTGMLPPNGTVTYSASGLPEIFGTLNFTINMLGESFPFTVQNNPLKIVITGPEIELAIVIIIVIVLTVAVKAPNRDEFYIDVPVMPRPRTVDLTVKPAELLSTFDKLNMYYHWKYMPLSIGEVKTAIKSNIRSSNMPVTITYNNAESVLEQLTAMGQLESIDNLYAPTYWIEESGHDIEYLATFKKMRMWFVMHACLFTDINSSELADIVTTVNGERAYITIYSKTSGFKRMQVQDGVQSYIAFLNSERLMEFRDRLDGAMGDDIELLKMHIMNGTVKLIDADRPDAAFGE